MKLPSNRWQWNFTCLGLGFILVCLGHPFMGFLCWTGCFSSEELK